MSSSRWWRKNEGLGRTLVQLGLGQLVSLDLSIMGFTASLIATQVDAPLTLSFSTYLALAVVYGSILLYRRHKLLVPWYWYVLLGFVDVHGNYLVNKAFQFTSITSVALLDCWTIAWAIILTWIFLGTKYSVWQFLGAAICVGGLGLVLLSDVGVGGGGGSNPLLGDFLVILGSLLFSMSNVGEEFCVKRKDRIEVIAMIGVFGMLVSAIEMYPFSNNSEISTLLNFHYLKKNCYFLDLIYSFSTVVERKTLESMKWSAGLLSTYAVYAVTAFLFYTLVPYVLEMSGATLFNLSLLTSDMWAVAFRILVYKQKVDWLYYLAFLVVVVGIFIYSKTENNPNSTTSVHENANFNPEYHLIDEENCNPGN